MKLSTFILAVLTCVSSCQLSGASISSKDATQQRKAGPTPIVFYHGLGDSCCNPLSLGGFAKFVQEEIPGVHINSLKIGDYMLQEIEYSYFENSNVQVATACELIKNDSALASGYHAVGFSQGSQFLRAVAQRCPDPPMLNLVTLGGQHQGIFGLPRCPGEQSRLCNLARQLLNVGAYWDFVQSHLVPAQYWHDPLHRDVYVAKSLFLADINNERPDKNATYKENLQKLKNFVMVMFENDTVVDPKESAWFSYYPPGDDMHVVPLQQQLLYKEDWLGLKKMDKAGKLKFLATPGDHLQFEKQWFVDNILNVYLKD
ncbi:palmitoyl-protein thioesterase 1-like [Ornithodoros turicata]|uniref:palmitoyl-protein thioesterase 1-like n=1 Tax=Ornithodoros turicata TaxID=34597 RepID=UPI0031390633